MAKLWEDSELEGLSQPEMLAFVKERVDKSLAGRVWVERPGVHPVLGVSKAVKQEDLEQALAEGWHRVQPGCCESNQ